MVRSRSDAPHPGTSVAGATGPALPSRPGGAVHVDFRKWDGGEHWQFDTTYLGTDRYGIWLGVPPGADLRRPGAGFTSSAAQVVLIPDDDFSPVFHDHGAPGHLRIYVDITTRPVWRQLDEGHVVTVVDMDLDVIETTEGHIHIDDEDEFAEHEVAYGYPAEVVQSCEATCDRVLTMLGDRVGPFDGTGQQWLRSYVESLA